MGGPLAAGTALYSSILNAQCRTACLCSCKPHPDIRYHMSGFVEVLDNVHSARAWAEVMVRLHLSDMGNSPDSGFGFHLSLTWRIFL